MSRPQSQPDYWAPPWCPPEWKVDPLKLACILRAADAAHLDAKRAPIFPRAISNLTPASEEHWKFQEKLNTPYLNQDSMVYTAPAFRFNEAGAWWLCLDTFDWSIGSSLSIDAMFADKGLPRFDARRVQR